MPISTTYNPSAPAATTTQGAAVGNREDLSNELAMLAPEKTPLLSLCAKGKASSTFCEWTADKLDTVDTAGIAEGADVTSFDDKFASRARLGNYVQIFRKPWLVSNLQNAVTTAAPANAAAAQAKSIMELKRNIEARLCSNSDRTVEDGAGTPYTTRGLGDWLDSAGPSDVPADYRTPTASIHTSGAFTEAGLNNILGSIFSKTGDMANVTLLANVALRKVIANFSRIDDATTSSYTINEDAGSKKITLAVNVFDSDFGIVNVVNANPDCMPGAATNEGYIVNPSYLAFNTLIPMGSQQLENQGGGQRGYVEAVGAFLCKHPQAHGKIAYS
jgi:hypothetical protein